MSVTHVGPDLVQAIGFSSGQLIISQDYDIPTDVNLLVVNLSLRYQDGLVTELPSITFTFNGGLFTLLVQSPLNSDTYTATYYLLNPTIGAIGTNQFTFESNTTIDRNGVVIYVVQPFTNVNPTIPFASRLSGIDNLSPLSNVVEIPAPNPPTFSDQQLVVDVITLNTDATIVPDPSAEQSNYTASVDIFEAILAQGIYYRDRTDANRQYNYTVIVDAAASASFVSYVINGASLPPPNPDITYSGQAIGLIVTGTVAGVPITPVMFGDTGALPATGGTLSFSAANVSVDVPPLGTVTIGAVNLMTAGFDNISQSTSAVTGLNLNLTSEAIPFTITASADSLISNSQCICTGLTSVCTGSTSAINLSALVETNEINASIDSLSGDITPNFTATASNGNQTINIIANEQIFEEDTITVNALHISLEIINPAVIIDVIIGQVHSDIHCSLPPICVAGNTKILMADGTEKEIQNVRRGELVVTNAEKNEIRPVAHRIKNYIGPDVKLRMVRISKNALAPNMPNEPLLITASHPIVWNGERKRSKFFRKIPGVKFYPLVKASDILPADDNGHYALYDLIFEDNLYYHANGVLVQAHSPECLIGTLPEELYFNREKIDHVCDYPHPLVNTLVNKIKTN